MATKDLLKISQNGEDIDFAIDVEGPVERDTLVVVLADAMKKNRSLMLILAVALLEARKKIKKSEEEALGIFLEKVYPGLKNGTIS